MPTQRRLGPDYDQRRPQPGQTLESPTQNMRSRQDQADPAPAEPPCGDRDLVTQRTVFGLQGRSGAEQITKDADEEAQHRA